METRKDKLLRFTFENAKLKGIWHFSLPSGWTCPGAKQCKTFADKMTGKIMDEQTPVDGVIFRCYAAMDEARRPNVRKVRWENFDLLKAAKQDLEALTKSAPWRATHTSGGGGAAGGGSAAGGSAAGGSDDADPAARAAGD